MADSKETHFKTPPHQDSPPIPVTANGTGGKVNYDNFNIKTIFSGDDKTAVKSQDVTILDRDWVRSRYLVPDANLDPDILSIRYSSNASLKFTDSSLGGNIMINPRPQFTRYADVKIDNVVNMFAEPTTRPGSNLGMGEYYSSTIDDNQQVIFMEFGLPEFNSLSDFFFRAIDYRDSVIANTGRPPTMYNLGKIIGNFVAFVAFTIITISIWIIKYGLKLLFGDKTLKYYYMRPDMHMYWSVVNGIVTQLVTEQGLLNPIIDNRC